MNISPKNADSSTATKPGHVPAVAEHTPGNKAHDNSDKPAQAAASTKAMSAADAPANPSGGPSVGQHAKAQDQGAAPTAKDVAAAGQPVTPEDATSIKGKWKQLSNAAKAKWSRLTEDELAHSGGDEQKLSGLIRQRYGISQSESDKQVKEFSDTHTG